jgi:hypothetical protein
MPVSDVARRHEIEVRAPAEVVMEVARNFDIGSLRSVRFIFRMRALMLGSRAPAQSMHGGFVDEMLRIGWQRLEESPNHFVAGAGCQPWKADVVFRAISGDEQDSVKIVWSLEAEPLGPSLTRFASETRAVATDEEARVKFRRYWRMFGIGIVMIRKLLLPAIRKEAERRYRGAGF